MGGGVITIKLLRPPSQDHKLENDLNESIQEESKRLSGCFLVDSAYNWNYNNIFDDRNYIVHIP